MARLSRSIVITAACTLAGGLLLGETTVDAMQIDTAPAARYDPDAGQSWQLPPFVRPALPTTRGE